MKASDCLSAFTLLWCAQQALLLFYTQLASPFEKAQALLAMKALLLDEISMVDVESWWKLEEILGSAQVARNASGREPTDAFGELHVVLFGDFQQLPPASSNPPCIVLPAIYEIFEFEELEENRRVVDDPTRAAELDNFHGVLADKISN